MNKSDRARQFLPFNSLRGYYELVRKAEVKKMPRKHLVDEELIILSNKFKQVKKGMIVTVSYYLKNGYIDLIGMVANIDEVFKTITIVNTVISFKDIIDIKSDEIKEENIEIL